MVCYLINRRFNPQRHASAFRPPIYPRAASLPTDPFTCTSIFLSHFPNHSKTLTSPPVRRTRSPQSHRRTPPFVPLVRPQSWSSHPRAQRRRQVTARSRPLNNLRPRPQRRNARARTASATSRPPRRPRRAPLRADEADRGRGTLQRTIAMQISRGIQRKDSMSGGPPPSHMST